MLLWTAVDMCHHRNFLLMSMTSLKVTTQMAISIQTVQRQKKSLEKAEKSTLIWQLIKPIVGVEQHGLRFPNLWQLVKRLEQHMTGQKARKMQVTFHYSKPM